MAEKTIEDYKRALMQMHKRAQPAVAQPLPWLGDPEDSGRGTVIVVVTSGRGSVPVSQALVTVSRTGERETLATLRTNESGQTTPLSLPAPKRILSESPAEQGESVFSLYDIAVTADGFVPERLHGVPVFDGVVSLQPMQLLTLSASGGGDTPISEIEPNPYEL